MSSNSSSREVRRAVQEFLNDVVYPRVAPLLVDRGPYAATYMNKAPGGSIVWAHQDWSYTDETRHESAMVWIPLCDVDERTGALGFIGGSHRYFDYLRAFPVPLAETPVVRHRLKLIPYFNLVPMKAGEALLFSNKIVHGSLPNYGDRDRLAVSLTTRPIGEPLRNYMIKPNGRVDTLLEYHVSTEFFVDYNNPRMLGLYREGRTIEDYELVREVPYDVERIDWDELERKLLSSGNHRDPWIAEKTEEFYGIALFGDERRER